MKKNFYVYFSNKKKNIHYDVIEEEYFKNYHLIVN